MVSQVVVEGTPWQYSGYELALSLQRAQVQSLIGELRSQKGEIQPKKKTKAKKLFNLTQFDLCIYL